MLLAVDCVTTNTPLLTPTTHHWIGLINLMGRETQAKFVGWWAFANKSWLGEATEWQMGKKCEALMVAGLKQRGFEVVVPSYDRTAWTEHYLDKIYSLNPMDLFSVGQLQGRASHHYRRK
jgi:hypothetical protein